MERFNIFAMNKLKYRSIVPPSVNKNIESDLAIN